MEEEEKEYYLCDECDEIYEDQMDHGQCCEGATIRIVMAGDLGW